MQAVAATIESAVLSPRLNSPTLAIPFGLQARGREIRIRGAPVRFRSPRWRRACGWDISRSSPSPCSSLAEHRDGTKPKRGPLIDERLARAQVQVAELARRHRLDVDPNAAGRDLSVGVRQRVEILKTLYRDTRILILDELTAALTSPERDALFLASYEASSPRGDRWF